MPGVREQGETTLITVHIRAFARFRELFGDRFEVEVVSPATVQSVMLEVGKRNGQGVCDLFDDGGKVKKSVIIMVNRERITGETRDEHPVHGGDEVALYPPVAGG